MKAFNPFGHNKPQPIEPIDTSEDYQNNQPTPTQNNRALNTPVVPTQSARPVNSFSFGKPQASQNLQPAKNTPVEPKVAPKPLEVIKPTVPPAPARTGFSFTPRTSGNASVVKAATPPAQESTSNITTAPVNNTNITKPFIARNVEPTITPTPSNNSNHPVAGQYNNPSITKSSFDPNISVAERRRKALAILSAAGNVGNINAEAPVTQPRQVNLDNSAIEQASIQRAIPANAENTAAPITSTANEAPTPTPQNSAPAQTQSTVKRTFQFGATKPTNAGPPINVESEQYKSLSGFVLEDALGLVDETTTNVHPSNYVAPKEVPTFEAERSSPQNNNSEQKRLEFLALRDKVKDIRIKEVAKVIGAHNNEDKIRNKWKMPWGDNVSIQGQKWYNHNSISKFKGGSDAISFAKYIMSHEFRYDLDDKIQARKAENRGVYWLGETFGEEIDKSDILAAKENLEYDFKKPYTVPVRFEDQYLQKVKDYIIIDRQVPAWVVEKQIAAKKLYAGIPNQYLNKTTYDNFGKRNLVKRDLHNLSDSEIYCVFTSGDDKIGAAECRCITEPWGENFQKGFSEGSHKKQCGFLVVGEPGFDKKEVALVEAAIDAMSYQAIHPWAHAISTGGTDNGDFVLKISREVLDNPQYKLVYAFDNDKAGDNFADAILEQLKKELTPEVIQQYITEGRLERRATSVGKDWNDYLKTIPVADLYQPSERPVVEEAVAKKTRVKKEATTVSVEPQENALENASEPTNVESKPVVVLAPLQEPQRAAESVASVSIPTPTIKEEPVQTAVLSKEVIAKNETTATPPVTPTKTPFTFNFKRPVVKEAIVEENTNIKKFKFNR